MAPAGDEDGESAGGVFAAHRLALLALFGFAGLVYQLWAGGADWSRSWNWVPSLGIELAWRLDGLSRLFALLILGIGFVVALYASGYFKGSPLIGRMVTLIALFMAAMLGLVLADDVISLFVFWELTTLTSYLLIGYAHADPKARRAALMGLLVTGAGGLALLAGLLLLGNIAGTYRISAMAAAGAELRAHPLYPTILALILVGAFTKSAQLPFHFWLPGAMAAPTPISAYLHSATMVKAGVYLLARLTPVLGGTPEWFWLLSVTGAVTSVWASVMALRQTDLKLMLAWTTVVGLGTLVMFLGAGGDISVKAAMTFVIVHALYKCSLFLVVGNIDHATGTRQLDELGGLWRAMPVTAAVACLSALSMAGFPPFLGSIGKDLKYEGALAIAEEPLLFAAAAVAANAISISVALTLAITPFFGPRHPTPRQPHEPGWWMLLGPVALAVTGMVLGIDPDLVFRNVIGPAAASVLGVQEPVIVEIAKGPGLALTLSFATVAAGIALYLARARFRAVTARLAAALPLSGDRFFDAAIAGLKAFAGRMNGLLQNGSLTWYLAVTFATAGILPGVALLRAPPSLPELPALGGLAWDQMFVVLLMAAATLVVVLASSRLLAICALGIVGYGTAYLYVANGAVDVALTQLMVETLFVVIVAVVLLKLPGIAHQRQGPGIKVRNAAIAALHGAVVGGILLHVTAMPVDRSVTSFFEGASLTEAYGRNIVNVILVDFRALDTMGEIAVVAIAALGIWAMLRLRPLTVVPEDRR